MAWSRWQILIPESRARNTRGARPRTGHRGRNGVPRAVKYDKPSTCPQGTDVARPTPAARTTAGLLDSRTRSSSTPNAEMTRGDRPGTTSLDVTGLRSEDALGGVVDEDGPGVAQDPRARGRHVDVDELLVLEVVALPVLDDDLGKRRVPHVERAARHVRADVGVGVHVFGEHGLALLDQHQGLLGVRVERGVRVELGAQLFRLVAEDFAVDGPRARQLERAPVELADALRVRHDARLLRVLRDGAAEGGVHVVHRDERLPGQPTTSAGC
mmetsp:Transcript_15092/g.60627  ORF Transcript_15092/g.60627 Transcript_15092/m.60627 type:complete len:270 (-) Transcript_15092:27-836(-)